MTHCLVHSCQNIQGINKDVTFHLLPADPEQKILWLKAIKRDVNVEYSRWNRVCSIHFKEGDFNRHKKLRTLSKTAVPSQNLPSTAHLKRKHHYDDVIFVPEKSSKSDLDNTQLSSPPYSSDVISVPEISTKIDLDNDQPHSSTSIKTNIFPLPLSPIKNPLLKPLMYDSPGGSSSTSTSSFENKDILGEIPFPSFEVTISSVNMESDSPGESNSSLAKGKSERSYSSGSSVKRRRKTVKIFHNYSVSPSRYQKGRTVLDVKQKRLTMDKKNKSKQIKRLKKKILHLKDVISELRKKNLLSSSAITDLEKTISGIPLAVMKRHIINVSRKKPTREKYPEELRAFALTLNFYSTKAYEYVRKTFAFCLPAQSVIRSWYSKIDCSPGYTVQSFHLLQTKNDEYHNENKVLLCSLMLDEMSIRKKVEMIGNKVYGYVDLGTGLEDDEEAQEALVIMVVAVNGDWKVPVAYFLIKSLSGSEKANIVKETLSRLYEINIRIISLTCDGPSSHFSMLTELGCNFKDIHSIDNIKYWFEHPCDQNIKIYAILDPCHMLKLIRNLLSKLGIIKNPNGDEICWSFIEKLFQFQSEQQLNLANKLKKSHINWHKQKMKVNIAAQTLSNSVAEAIQYLAEDEKLALFKNSHATVEFIKIVDGAFDYLNSRNPFGKGTKSPLRPVREAVFRPFLNNAVNFLSKCTDAQGKLLLMTPRKTGVLGFIVSVKSALSLYDEYVGAENSPLKYLLTYKFSQDHLELYFCWIRSRNGWNNNPSAFQMTYTYKRLLLHHEIKKITGNCIPIDDTSILSVSSRSKSNPTQILNVSDVNAMRKYNLDIDSTHFDTAVPEIENVPGLNTIIENVIAYVAGYVIKMVQKKVNCLECLDSLEESFGNAVDDTHMKLLNRKNKGGLVRPSNSVFFICKLYEMEIRRMMNITNNKLPPENSYKKILTHFLTQKLLQNQSIFEDLADHVFDTSIGEEMHKKRLIQEIGNCFLKLRMHYIGKLHTERIAGNLIRKELNKLILFHHQ